MVIKRPGSNFFCLRIRQEFHERIQDRFVSGFIEIIQRDEIEPEKIVGTVCDRTDVRSLMPPVIYRAIWKLLFGVEKNLFFRELRPCREKDLAILSMLFSKVFSVTWIFVSAFILFSNST